ncbi:MAG: DUF2784 domain-containing protein [Betaproteobacteria bacterium]|nr:DUF2784 domain-containing protein [Betaproteobacteria bacterium]MDE2123059.1 DUF2784 domain-containing protein [Betaproteobacteria bacterium]MDE2186003.1 DUF2784 domain-containing protein [Betaproteobacteria bacterium]MDE2325669.1 DUF2784 domain-containing protein [Betaproteobacteria bacterium]
MLAQFLADLVVLVHALFVLWVVLGGLLVLRQPRLAWLHLPALAWGVLVEWAGLMCPLTLLQNALLHRAHQAGYSGGFLTHELLAALYPDGLTRPMQWALGTGLLVFNGLVYAVLARRLRRLALVGPDQD